MADPEAAVVLNVNDEDAARYALSRMLRRAGFRVEEAATGAEALARAAERPDLILLDVQLPDLSGWDVCARVRADPATADIPVIYLSAYFTESEDRAHGLDRGADAYLVQPVQPRELVATVRAMLRVRRAERQARAAARDWQATFDALSDGVALLDRAGTVVRANRALAGLLGRPPADIAGRNLDELVRQALGFAAPLPEGYPERCERQAAERRQGERWFRVSADPVRDEAGVCTGAVAVLADMTDQKRAEKAEKELRASAAVIEGLRSELAGLEQLARRFTGPGEPGGA